MPIANLIGNKDRTLGETIKLGVGLVIGIAADIAVTALMKQHLPVSNGITKLLTKLGVFAIGMKIGEDAENYFYKVCGDTKQAILEAKVEAEKAVLAVIDEEKDEGGH